LEGKLPLASVQWVNFCIRKYLLYNWWQNEFSTVSWKTHRETLKDLVEKLFPRQNLKVAHVLSAFHGDANLAFINVHMSLGLCLAKLVILSLWDITVTNMS
jgi:hypothetical protein